MFQMLQIYIKVPDEYKCAKCAHISCSESRMGEPRCDNGGLGPRKSHLPLVHADNSLPPVHADKRLPPVHADKRLQFAHWKGFDISTPNIYFLHFFLQHKFHWRKHLTLTDSCPVHIQSFSPVLLVSMHSPEFITV